MRLISLALIRFYQGYISPYKGFHCAYGAHTGCASCSALGYRAVRRYGTWGGLTVLRERMYRCGVAYRRYAPSVPRPHRSQRGDCDLMFCDVLPCFCGCDLFNRRSAIRFMDRFSGGNSDGYCGLGRKRKSVDDEKSVYIPPQRQKGNSACGPGL